MGGFHAKMEAMETLWPALASLLVVLVLTPVVAMVARHYGIVDAPGGRRIHAVITPRLGGVAVIVAFFAGLAVAWPDVAPNFRPGQLAGFTAAAVLLLIVGVIDDRRGVPPVWQLASHVAVALILVGVGMGIDEISSPFGGKIPLNGLEIGIPAMPGKDIQLPADLLTVAWVVLVINAVNWLDGLDGLASGVGAISAVTIALLSVSMVVDQPHVAVLAMLLAASLIGFLAFNFNPARIFLGTAGSTFIGFTLATLAIISGGKIATAILVLGFPILDALAVIIRRTAGGGLPWQADATHLHHRLLGRGWSVRKTVLTIYAISAGFGGLALLAGTTGYKALALLGMAALMAVVLGRLSTGPATGAK